MPSGPKPVYVPAGIDPTDTKYDIPGPSLSALLIMVFIGAVIAITIGAVALIVVDGSRNRPPLPTLAQFPPLKTASATATIQKSGTPQKIAKTALPAQTQTPTPTFLKPDLPDTPTPELSPTMEISVTLTPTLTPTMTWTLFYPTARARSGSAGGAGGTSGGTGGAGARQPVKAAATPTRYITVWAPPVAAPPTLTYTPRPVQPTATEDICLYIACETPSNDGMEPICSDDPASYCPTYTPGEDEG